MLTLAKLTALLLKAFYRSQVLVDWWLVSAIHVLTILVYVVLVVLLVAVAAAVTMAVAVSIAITIAARVAVAIATAVAISIAAAMTISVVIVAFQFFSHWFVRFVHDILNVRRFSELSLQEVNILLNHFILDVHHIV